MYVHCESVLVLCDLNKKKKQEESTPTDRRAVQPSLLHPRSSYAYFLVRHCHLPPFLHHVTAAPNYYVRVKALHRSCLIDARGMGIYANLNDMCPPSLLTKRRVGIIERRMHAIHHE